MRNIERTPVLHKELRTQEGSPLHRDALIIHSGNDRVGGIILQVVSDQVGIDGKDNSLFLDFGALMDVSGRYFGNYAQLPYSAGLRPLFTLGIIPPIPGIWREDLPNKPTLNELTEAWEQSKRVTPSDIERVKIGVRYLLDRGVEARGVVHSHYHWDHVGNSVYLRGDIPLYTTPITWAVMQAQEKHWGADWRREVTIYRLPPQKQWQKRLFVSPKRQTARTGYCRARVQRRGVYGTVSACQS